MSCDLALLFVHKTKIINTCFLQNPKLCDVYTQHAKEATVAVYAPTGYYIASGGKLLNLYHN